MRRRMLVGGVVLCGLLGAGVSFDVERPWLGGFARPALADEKHTHEDEHDHKEDHDHGDHNHGDHDHDHGEHHGEHGPHEHGRGYLQVVSVLGEMELVLRLSGADVVGFEREPETPEERQAIEVASEALSDPMALFQFPAGADCTGEPGVMVWEASGEGHTEVHAQYKVICAHGEELDGFALTLFDAFPSLQEVDVQVVTYDGQISGELTPDEPRLSF